MLMRVTFPLLFALVYSQAAFACSCAPPPPPAAALRQASAVFAGRVIAISPAAGHRKRVVFRAEEIWKGASSPFISVSTWTDEAACGNSYSIGERWLVYANGGNALTTSLCSRTTQIQNAQQDLQALGIGSTPPSVRLWIISLLSLSIILSLSVRRLRKRG